MKPQSQTVSFRADKDLLRHIDQQCGRFGISRGNWVRAIVIADSVRDEESLDGLMTERVQRSLDDIVREVAALNTNLARSLFYILTHVGDMHVESARDLVRSKLVAREDA